MKKLFNIGHANGHDDINQFGYGGGFSVLVIADSLGEARELAKKYLDEIATPNHLRNERKYLSFDKIKMIDIITNQVVGEVDTDISHIVGCVSYFE
jgi:hypothetical protein